MDKTPEYKRCSVVSKGGQACRAWAIRGSSPPLCVAHAGRNKGAGAPKGNQNALKHGFYAPSIRAETLADLEQMQSPSLEGELVLARYLLSHLVAYVMREDIDPEAVKTVVPVIFTGLRTITRIASLIEEGGPDWDAVLDLVGAELDIDI